MSSDFRVGAWQVTPSLNSISCGGTTVHLEPKVIEVLACLATQPGQTLSKEALFQAVWPNTVVTDDVLKRCIAELRRAFKDDAREPHIIETIPKRGYRLVAPVTVAAEVAPAPSVVRDSIVVLPFISMSSDPENEYFADGITEEIINALAQIRELHVVARSSAFSFKGKHIEPRTVGEQLNVRTILEGSVRRADNRLRITAQLINAADGYHLWSERYDREMKDVFEIQDEIARGIAARLRVTMEAGEERPLVMAGTQNLEAYQLYLKGRVLLPRRGSIMQYLDCFERATKLDSAYAQAWAGLADSYTVLGYMGSAPPGPVMQRGLEAARRAVALDGSVADAHNALAMASYMGAWEPREAEREFLRALALNPRYIQARDWYAMFYLMFSEGRMAEAVAEAKLALDGDPLSSYAHSIYGFNCAYAGEYAHAVDAARRAVEIDPDSYLARFVLGEVLRVTGDLEGAAATAEVALALSGRHVWAQMVLGLTFADWGKTADADAVYAEVFARSRRQYVPPGPLAILASAAAREDEAIRHAQDAVRIRDPHCQYLWSGHARMPDRLYAYPRFREVIARMGRNEWLRD